MAKKRPAYGNYVWLDLISKNPGATQTFFHDVFGWKMTNDRKVPGYTFYEPSAEPEGGVRKVTRNEAPANRPYIGVKSIDKTLRKIRAAGGKVLTPKTKIPPGWFAVFRAPGGVVQGLLEFP